jgi:hypothetical protein
MRVLNITEQKFSTGVNEDRAQGKVIRYKVTPLQRKNPATLATV